MILDARDIHVSTMDGRPLLAGIDLHVKSGELVIVEGPNGAGKSTLLKALVGLHPLDSAQVSHEPSSIEYLPQLANMKFLLPLTLAEVSELKSRGRARETSLQPWNTASGGERQMTLLRALFSAEASLFVLDEPLNHLDASARLQVLNWIKEALKRGSGFVVVSHESPDMSALAARTLVLGGSHERS